MKNLSSLFSFRPTLRNCFLLSAALLTGTIAAQAQNAVVQSFTGTNNNTSTELGYTGNPSIVTGNARGGPNQNSPLFVDNGIPTSISSWGIRGGSETVLFRNRTTTAVSTGNYIQLRVGAWGLAPGVGLDLTDEVNVYVSIDGGQTYRNTLRVTGRQNGSDAYWDFSPGRVNSISYATSANPTVIGPATGNPDKNGAGFDNYRISLPDGALSIRFYIVATNNDPDELWTIDEVTVGNSNSAPLPVELKSFTAEAATRGTQVRWATASEKNNAGFEVQRGNTPTTFTTVARIAGQGTSNQSHSYEWLDVQPLAGLSYYRLRQLDTDGTESFSPVVTVQRKGEAKEVAFFPNPTTGLVTLNSSLGAVRYRVRNALGQTVLAGEGRGGNSIDMQSLRTGAYFLEIESAAGSTVQRFMREL